MVEDIQSSAEATRWMHHHTIVLEPQRGCRMVLQHEEPCLRRSCLLSHVHHLRCDSKPEEHNLGAFVDACEWSVGSEGSSLLLSLNTAA